MNPIDFMRLKRLGVEAERLLADETFREILADLKNRAIRGWADNQTTEEREASWYDLQAAGRLENRLAELGQQYRAEARKAEAREKRPPGPVRRDM